MRYGFGQITIDEVVVGMEKIIARNTKTINSLLESAIPLYNRLRIVLEKTNNPKEENTQIVPLGSHQDITKIPKDIKIEDINNYAYENDCLRILVKTDKALLAQKLAPLKEICDVSVKTNLLSE